MPGASSYIISSLFGLQPHAVGSANSSHSFLIPAPTEPILFNSPASAALATAAGYLSHRPPWPMASENSEGLSVTAHKSPSSVVSRHTSSSQPRRTRQYVPTYVRMAPSVMATWRRRPPPPSLLHSKGSCPPPDSPSPGPGAAAPPPAASATSSAAAKGSSGACR
jgi:hypothetical protein